MITIREAVAADAARIADIAADTVDPSWTEKYVTDRLGRDDTHVLVAVAGSFIAGFAAFRQTDDVCELLQIAVDKAFRRSGTGSLLLSSVIDTAKEKELTSVFLEVRESNTAAIALYEKHGFRQMRVRKNYYPAPLEDAIVMSNELQAERAVNTCQ